MAEQDEGFLRRWSRRKQKRAGGDRAPEGAPTAEAREAEETSLPAAASGGEEAPAAIEESELPDIESLDGESDYSPFMREGVPEMLRNRALRKLWRSNPVLANLDGLNDYDEDFALAFETAKLVAEKARELGREVFGDDAPATPEGDAADGDAAAPSDEAGGDAADATPPDRVGSQALDTGEADVEDEEPSET